MPRQRHTCTIPECGAQCVSNGLCDKHRKRLARYGDPLATKRIIGDDEARWWSHVDRRGPDECWPWTACLDDSGYGQFWDGRHVTSAARWGYEHFVRKLSPSAPMPDHTCHDPKVCTVPHRKCPHRACCNWRHLEPVTNRENSLRGARTKLSDETVAVLYDLHRKGAPVKSLAVSAGVDKTTLYRRFHRLELGVPHMPAFVVGELVESLDYDFTGKKKDGSVLRGWPRELADVKGTLREPSDAAIGRFLEKIRDVYKTAKETGLESIQELGDDPGAADVMSVLDQVTGDDFVKVMTEMCSAFSELFGNKPTARQIQALPLRARTAFFDWVMTEVVRPEAGSADGGAVVTALPSAVTG